MHDLLRSFSLHKKVEFFYGGIFNHPDLSFFELSVVTSINSDAYQHFSISPKCLIHTNMRVSCFLYLPDTKLVGPLLSSPAESLTEELEQFVRGSGDKGVILVSFGSILGEISDQTISTMADVFSTLPQRVIWKLNTGTIILKLFSFQRYFFFI